MTAPEERRSRWIPWAFVAFSVVGLALTAVGIRGTREMSRMAYRARSFSR